MSKNTNGVGTTRLEDEEDVLRQSRSGLRRATTMGLALALTALLVWQRHRLASLPTVVLHADWVWLGAAILAQAASVDALARQQQSLLKAGGNAPPMTAMLATTYAGNAITNTVPVVGSATAAMFTYRRFLTGGAEKAVAGWALIISGIVSSIGFATITAVAAVLSGSPGVAVAGILAVAMWVVPIALLLTNLQKPRVQRMALRSLTWLIRTAGRMRRRPVHLAATADPLATATSAMEQVSAIHLTHRAAAASTWWAAVNWAMDISCLAFAVLAVHGRVSLAALVLGWAAGATVSTLGLTPGGLGTVEAALGVSLVAAGLPAGLAAAAIAIYRVIKLGLVVGAGWVTLLVIRKQSGRGWVKAGRPEPQLLITNAG